MCYDYARMLKDIEMLTDNYNIIERFSIGKSVMQKDIPCAVGFGISTLEQAKKMTEQADGVIVGSAIVKLCETYGEDCVPYVGEYVKSMKDAIR